MRERLKKSPGTVPIDVAADPMNLRRWVWDNRIKHRLVASPSGCLEWSGGLSHGYGVAGLGNGLLFRLHRVCVELRIGRTLRAEEYVCHTCDNRRCCADKHLVLADAAWNIGDKTRKHRAAKKLTPGAVTSIRERYVLGESKACLARHFGVSHATVRYVIARKVWAHV